MPSPTRHVGVSVAIRELRAGAHLASEVGTCLQGRSNDKHLDQLDSSSVN